MSGYEVEHNIDTKKTAEQTHRRPDLSTFFSALEYVDTTGSRQPQNAHSVPLPSEIGAPFTLLANAFNTMRREHGSPDDSSHNELMDRLIETLMTTAEHPPTTLQGVSDEFIASLDRVDKTELSDTMSCPICANPFLDDKYPLVVRLPCHKDHMFDLECIEPWLKLNPTCPLDRKEINERKVEIPKHVDDDEEEYDDMYA
ncbi:hypothetical protein AMS68_007307 [Peltaster fructicola]|uniref:RING-type domain-containing protein n=1 Tax=Peltaster fructicola TaxID=286661 RepID=A0A6H0Y5A7_9PEZI|nr:hypothetical protein AMS68_007307 [Peltaster fructicola]